VPINYAGKPKASRGGNAESDSSTGRHSASAESIADPVVWAGINPGVRDKTSVVAPPEAGGRNNVAVANATSRRLIAIPKIFSYESSRFGGVPGSLLLSRGIAAAHRREGHDAVTAGESAVGAHFSRATPESPRASGSSTREGASERRPEQLGAQTLGTSSSSTSRPHSTGARDTPDHHLYLVISSCADF